MHKRPKQKGVDPSNMLNRSLTISQSSVYGLNSSVMVTQKDNFDTQNDSMTPELIYEAQWNLPSNLGQRYEGVCKDYNVIHVSSILAKAFGFPSMIIHGMYMAARIGEECKKSM